MYKKYLIAILFLIFAGCRKDNEDKVILDTVQGRVYTALAVANTPNEWSEDTAPTPPKPKFKCEFCEDTGRLGDFGGPCPHCELGKQRKTQQQRPLPLNGGSVVQELSVFIDYVDFQKTYLKDGKWVAPDGDYFIMISGGPSCRPCIVLKNGLKSLLPNFKRNIIVYEAKDIETAINTWNVQSVPRLFKFKINNGVWERIELPPSQMFNNNGSINSQKILEFING